MFRQYCGDDCRCCDTTLTHRDLCEIIISNVDIKTNWGKAKYQNNCKAAFKTKGKDYCYAISQYNHIYIYKTIYSLTYNIDILPNPHPQTDMHTCRHTQTHKLTNDSRDQV